MYMIDNYEIKDPSGNIIEHDEIIIRLNNPSIKLTPRTKEILLQRFKSNKSLNEIGLMFNVSRERIRQIIKKGIRQLGLRPPLQGKVSKK